MPPTIATVKAPRPSDLLPALSTRPHPFLLESALRDAGFGSRSFAGTDPFLTLTCRGRRIEIRGPDGEEVREGDPLEAVRELLRRFRLDPAEHPGPLPAGAVGFLSYDLGRSIERIPDLARDDLRLPDLFLACYDAVLCVDHGTGTATVTSTGLPDRGPAAATRARERARLLADLIEGARAEAVPPPRPREPLRSSATREEYLRMVARAKEWIAAGDVFQVNLSQRFDAETAEPGTGIYRRLARMNPACFAAWLRSPCGAEILSASPERFLRVRGPEIEACPIKGTRPRGRTPDEDRALARELLGSAKDLAELTMIVDLLRSDLGKVAAFGSVSVPELPALTRHPTVHHLHGRVRARLAPDRDLADLLRAAFPPGSVTGAPKVRAMEIIEESEPLRRGAYCGALGYLGFTGDADLAVAIRTAVLKDGRITFSAGGGVVADSSPEAEYAETLHKVRGLAAALGYVL